MQRERERQEYAAAEREQMAAERIVLLEQELREERERSRATSQLGSPRATTEGTPGPVKSTKMSKPPTLTDGKDPKFDAWLYKIKDRLTNNSDHYPDARSQIGFIASFCGGKAEDHILPRLREGTTRPFRTPEELLDFLAIIFHDSNRLANAKSDFRTLIMKGYDFDTFLTDFMHLAGEAEIPDEDYKFELNEKLEPRLAQAVASAYVSEGDFDQFSRHCSLVARSLKRAADRLPRRAPVRVGSAAPLPSGVRPFRAAQSPRSPLPTFNDPVKKELFEQHRCFNCKGTGHVARDCPVNEEVSAVTPTTTPPLPQSVDEESGNGDP